MTVTHEPIATDAEIEALERGLDEATRGPWKSDKTGLYIWAPSAKGEGPFPIADAGGHDAMIARMRGWGYYTGRGAGGLALSADGAVAKQRADLDHIARCDPDTIRRLLARLRVAESRQNAGAVQAKPLYLAKDIAEAVMGAEEVETALGHGDEADRFRAAVEVEAERVIRSALVDVPATGPLKLDNDQQVFFYEQDFYVLSNFSSFKVIWEGRAFPTSEHAYHWEKFHFEGFSPSTGLMWQVQNAPSAHEAFKLAERNRQYRRADWDDMKVGIMRGILRAKTDQHEYVRRKLLATGDRELIENSWRDDYWGWGPNRDGQNMLGKLWMELRAALRADGVTNGQ